MAGYCARHTMTDALRLHHNAPDAKVEEQDPRNAGSGTLQTAGGWTAANAKDGGV